MGRKTPDRPAATPPPAVRHSLEGRFSPGVIVAIFIAIVILAPLVTLIYLAGRPFFIGNVGDILAGEIYAPLFFRSAGITLILALSVAIMTMLIGGLTAWLVTVYEFPGRRFFSWALLLPLAIPTYIISFAYIEILDYAGPVQSLWRGIFGFQSPRDYLFPEIRSLYGAAFVMSFVTYPYVYLAALVGFSVQSGRILDAARTLGARPVRLFFRIALPMIRPALAAGVFLAVMESINDIGAVTFFGVQTLTFSIYDIWLNRSNLPGAALLALLLLAIVLMFLWVERRLRKQRRFSTSDMQARTLSRRKISGPAQTAIFLICALPLLLGFLLPVSQLLKYALRRPEKFMEPSLLAAIGNSLSLSLTASAIILIFALMLAQGQRISTSPVLNFAARCASSGYAVPGTVLAIGIMILLALIDNHFDRLARAWLGYGTGLLLLGSGAGLIYAYLVRFMALAQGQIESGYLKISPHLDMAARSLGKPASAVFFRIHLPLLLPMLAGAFILIFVDCMKELPATILLRPFNFETLATMVYRHASREAFADSAPASLVIVFVGIGPVILLSALLQHMTHISAFPMIGPIQRASRFSSSIFNRRQ